MVISGTVPLQLTWISQGIQVLIPDKQSPFQSRGRDRATPEAQLPRKWCISRDLFRKPRTSERNSGGLKFIKTTSSNFMNGEGESQGLPHYLRLEIIHERLQWSLEVVFVSFGELLHTIQVLQIRHEVLQILIEAYFVLMKDVCGTCARGWWYQIAWGCVRSVL